MFSRFATVPSMATLTRDLRARGVTSKSWTTSKGIERKGKLVDKGYIYKIFNNAVYIGIAAYKGKHYPGEHEGIRELAERDATPLPQLTDEVATLAARVDEHLKRMGAT